MLAFLLFLLAWIFPPDIYSEYMQERDLMFLDPRAMLFFILCIGGFWFGQWLLEVFSPSARVGQSMTPKSISRTVFLALPLVVALAVNAMVLGLTLSRHPLLLAFLISSQGNALKEEAASAGGLMLATTVLTGLYWWALWRKAELVVEGWRRNLVSALVFLTFLSVFANCVVTVDRTELIPLVVGTCLISWILRIKEGTPRTYSGAVQQCYSQLASVLGLFILFSVLRGVDDSHYAIAELIAYTIASYNRLSALLSGVASLSVRREWYLYFTFCLL